MKALILTLGLSLAALSQVKTEVPPVESSAKPVTVERIKIHGASLEGNLEGNAVDRDAIVYLPPGYAANKKKHYPVLYALHGYSIGAEQWSGEIHTPQVIEGAFAKGAQDMIVVLPDSKTVHNGSMYSSSVTTGDFEEYVARDVVRYIDAHYRTIPQRTARGRHCGVARRLQGTGREGGGFRVGAGIRFGAGQQLRLDECRQLDHALAVRGAELREGRKRPVDARRHAGRIAAFRPRLPSRRCRSSRPDQAGGREGDRRRGLVRAGGGIARPRQARPIVQSGPSRAGRPDAVGARRPMARRGVRGRTRWARAT